MNEGCGGSLCADTANVIQVSTERAFSCFLCLGIRSNDVDMSMAAIGGVIPL